MNPPADETISLKELLLRFMESTDRRFDQTRTERHDLVDRISSKIAEVELDAAKGLKEHVQKCDMRAWALFGGSIGLNGFLAAKLLGWL